MESSSTKSISNPALSLHEHATIARGKRSYFYVGVAIASLLIVLAGFSLTYIVPMASGTFTGPPLIHAHGFIFFCWLILFIAQPMLVRNGNIKVHRKIGVFGFTLAVLMFSIGLWSLFTQQKLKVRKY